MALRFYRPSLCVAFCVIFFCLWSGVMPCVGQAPPQGTSPTASLPSPTTVPSLEDLKQMIERGRATAALEQLDKMAADPSPAPGVLRLQGRALYSQGKLAAAEKAFAKALDQDPADQDARQMRGISLYRLGKPEAAIPLLESKANDPRTGPVSKTPADPQYVLALCYLDTRRYDDARHAFAAQYGFPPESASAYLLAARMLLRREYIPVAEESARKALQISPTIPLAHILLGETALAGEHLDEAIQQFQQERQINPLYPAIYDRLGDAYIRRGDFDSARQYLQEAVLLEPNFTGPFILLGKVLLKQQDAASAANYLEHARGMDPQNYMTHSLLGQAYRQLGRTDDARRETATAEKLQAASAPKIEDLK